MFHDHITTGVMIFFTNGDTSASFSLLGIKQPNARPTQELTDYEILVVSRLHISQI